MLQKKKKKQKNNTTTNLILMFLYVMYVGIPFMFVSCCLNNFFLIFSMYVCRYVHMYTMFVFLQNKNKKKIKGFIYLTSNGIL